MIRFEDISEKVLHHFPSADVTLLQRAYIFSAREHAGQQRKSGEPYLAHPLEVASILADMGLDPVAVTVGLLHDIVEDTLTDVESIRKMFGDTVGVIVDGVTKISQIPFTSTEHKQAENFRKLLLAMSNDVRVILVKLADRLHNMRTLQYLKPEQKARIARETMDIYVPIANRLGMGKIKGELEDLAFSYLEPAKYQEIIAMIEKRRGAGEKILRECQEKLRQVLAEHDIPASFQSRIKRVCSIHAKLKNQKISFDEVYDFLALRVISTDIPHCYTILAYVHSLWKLVPGRFKDYIGMPRPNGYQSIHTTVMTETGIPLEVQIRTQDMHRMAEEGIAAHWRYKEGQLGHDETDRRFTWLRHMMEWQKEVENPHEFLMNLKVDLFPEEVYVFTPKGHVVTLPRGATPLDFAYEIHTEVGHHASQAKVNGRIVPMKQPLRNGDIVEIVTSPARHPTKEWMSVVRTTKARNALRTWLKRNAERESVELGRKLLEKEAFRLHKTLRQIQEHPDLPGHLDEAGADGWEKLLSGIGFGRVSPRKFVEDLLKPDEAEKEAAGMTGGIRNFVRDVFRRGPGKFVVHGMEESLVSRAGCCNPIPGEEIVGYVSRGRGIIVHFTGCANLVKLAAEPEQLVEVSWGKRPKDEKYTITLEIRTEDRKGMIADISNRISKTDANIRDFRAQATDSKEGVFMVTLDVEDRAQLDKILRTIRSIRSVKGVERIESLREGENRET